MADRPIIFSAPMVRALLEGKKKQTRRLVRNMPPPPAHDSLKHEPRHDVVYFDAYCGGAKTKENPRGMTTDWCWWTRDDRAGHGCRIGYVPGDHLYVREHWKTSVGNDGVPPRELDRRTPVRYLADGAERADYPVLMSGKHRQAMHMPRWASRLTLLVDDVRVQRLNDCSVEDAIAEGASCWICGGRVDGTSENDCNCFHSTQEAIQSYSFLWDTLHGDGSWDSNPWVVAITFRVERCNIDQLPEAEITRLNESGHSGRYVGGSM